MKRHLVLIGFFLLIICGCSAKTAPEWKAASFYHLEEYKKLFLDGKDQLAAIHFQRAIDELKSSGNLSLLMTVYLTRSALQVSVLDVPDNREYLETAKAAPDEDSHQYYLLLEGKFAQLKINRLPAPYQGLAAALEKRDEGDVLEEINGIKDDLSRLIAIGLAVRHQVENEAILTNAVDLASANGWRKPLLVYLDRLKSFYLKSNEPDKAEQIRLKIELLKS